MRILFAGIGFAFTMTATVVLFQNNNPVGYPLYVFFSTLNEGYFNTLLLIFFIGVGAGLFFGLALKTGATDDGNDDF